MSGSNKIIALTLAGIVGLGTVLVAGVWITRELGNRDDRSAGDISTFGSCVDLARYVNENRVDNFYPPYFDFDREQTDEATPGGLGSGERPTQPSPEDGRGTDSSDFTDTNIQVEGVDEADVVKTNGELLFVLNDTDLVIYNVENPLTPVKLSTTPVSGNPNQMFLYEDSVVVFGSDWNTGWFSEVSYLSGGKTEVLTYDVSDPKEPELTKEITIQGDYQTSRMIDGKVYFISNAGFYDYDGDVFSDEIERYIPLIQDNTEGEYVKAAECGEISYFGSSASSFVTVFAYDINSSEYKSKVLMGSSYQTYMSSENLYVVSIVNEFDEPIGREPIPIVDDIIVPRPQPQQEVTTKTDIFKFEVEDLEIEFNAKGTVDGQLLNQFAMDEYKGYFRVATTVSNLRGTGPSLENHMYVLDSSLNEVGSIENLGLDEMIYSVRFQGDIAYLVTFRQVDPFYAIDLSDPENPFAVGELKLPGVSDYLHPYTEDFIIGVGRQADERTGRIEGLKVALFDVSDISNPVLVNDVEIGGQGSYTDVTNDHKAFTFDKENGLLVIPTVVYETKQVGEPSQVEQNIIDYLQNIEGYSEYQITRSGSDITVNFTSVTNEFTVLFEEWLFNHGSILNINPETTTSSNGQLSLNVSMSVAQQSDSTSLSWSGFSLIDVSPDGLVLNNSVPFSGSLEYEYYYSWFGPRSIIFDNDVVLMVRNGILKTYSTSTSSVEFSESI
jgi:uncharacterized secreted protein with C-terminal beta-propeller domain